MPFSGVVKGQPEAEILIVAKRCDDWKSKEALSKAQEEEESAIIVRLTQTISTFDARAPAMTIRALVTGLSHFQQYRYVCICYVHILCAARCKFGLSQPSSTLLSFHSTGVSQLNHSLHGAAPSFVSSPGRRSSNGRGGACCSFFCCLALSLSPTALATSAPLCSPLFVCSACLCPASSISFTDCEADTRLTRCPA